MNTPSTGELWRELLERRYRSERNARAFYFFLIVAGSAAFYWSL